VQNSFGRNRDLTQSQCERRQVRLCLTCLHFPLAAIPVVRPTPLLRSTCFSEVFDGWFPLVFILLGSALPGTSFQVPR
jgi:hypothetical protein